jgi:hypothetical protein
MFVLTNTDEIGLRIETDFTLEQFHGSDRHTDRQTDTLFLFFC